MWRRSPATSSTGLVSERKPDAPCHADVRRAEAGRMSTMELRASTPILQRISHARWGAVLVAAALLATSCGGAGESAEGVASTPEALAEMATATPGSMSEPTTETTSPSRSREVDASAPSESEIEPGEDVAASVDGQVDPVVVGRADISARLASPVT